MKRLLVVTVLSLMALFLLTSLAAAQTGTSTSSTSSKVKPKRDRTKPYRFKVTGRVSFPPKYCGPNKPLSTCIPITCPPGATNAAYCTKPGLGQICTGKVKISFKKRGTTITKIISLRSDCSYSKRVTLKRKGRYKVGVKFQGNSLLTSSSASAKKVRAG